MVSQWHSASFTIADPLNGSRNIQGSQASSAVIVDSAAPPASTKASLLLAAALRGSFLILANAASSMGL